MIHRFSPGLPNWSEGLTTHMNFENKKNTQTLYVQDFFVVGKIIFH